MTNYERENEISTDEIIKRLERCVKRGNRNYDTDIVLDLIYRQQEDIERLKADNKTLENVIKNTFLKKAGLDIDPLAEVKAEAIKEFAERLKNIYIKDKRYDRPNAHTLIDWLFANIDNLVKEYEKGR